jgi:gamma-glutamyl-gamma-aminobutyrate hydrolase PuuD
LKIGLSQRILYFRRRAYDALEQAWYGYLEHHTLEFIPNRLDQDFVALASDIDAFIVTGGDDRPLRRATELKLATEIMKQGKPIIGVCHGAFLLTDILGGQVEVKDGHRDGVEHPVIYDGTEYKVNSFHGLYIRQTHTQAHILATDPDGDCESWIDGKIAAVVWHPERMAEPWLPPEIQSLLNENPRI